MQYKASSERKRHEGVILEDPGESNHTDAQENIERLASIGKFTAKIAHELNGPLDGVLRYINLTIRLLDQDQTDKTREYLQKSREGILRIAGIVDELLVSSRAQHASTRSITLAQIIDSAVRLAGHQHPGVKIHVAITCPQSLQTRRQGDLFHIVQNLVDNAYDAMPQGGKLQIACRLNPKGSLIMRFHDTGCGLPDPEANRIFDCFFSTKERGIGLGLAICKDIIHRFHGHISAKDNPGQGATFTVTIPREILR